MFDFQEIHLKALIKLLNFVNQEFLTTKTFKQTTRSGKSKLTAKATAKSAINQLVIESIELSNRQIVIDSLLNCCLYFDQYFKYNYKFVVYKTDDKITKLYKWLQNYYKKDFLDLIDFKIVIKEVPEIAVPVVANSEKNGDNNEDKSEENGKEDKNGEDLGLDTNPPPETQETSITDTPELQENYEELIGKIVQNLQLIILLVLIVYYKVRNLFPKLFDYFEFAWIYLSEFESKLESELEIENLIELLQNEFVSQRNANRMRSEVLSNEIIQLNAMIENLEKQYEDETKELIYLQNATIIESNNTSANCKQLSKIMNIKSAQQKEPKIYSCPECNKQFKNGYKLNRHRYVHKDPSEKPYMCDWPGCGYRSIANNDLNRHRMIHTGEKPFHCDYEGCERKYSRPDKLNHHKKMAHNKESVNKPFACDWPGCGYRSISNADLTRHQYIHTGERPYKCDFSGCDKAFSRPDKLRNHKDKARHNIEELTTVRPSAISIAECVPQAIAWT